MTTETAGVALVTGAARRIGRQIALDLASTGWSIAIHYNASVTEAQTVCDEIAALGGKTVLVKGDLSDHEMERLQLGEIGITRADHFQVQQKAAILAVGKFFAIILIAFFLIRTIEIFLWRRLEKKAGQSIRDRIMDLYKSSRLLNDFLQCSNARHGQLPCNSTY